MKHHSELPRALRSVDEIAASYDAVFSDVWGVLHNGEEKFAGAPEALARLRQAGLKVVLITNSPRTTDSVVAQIGALGIGPESFDSIVTSGDVTRELIKVASPKVFHIGSERDLDIFEGLGAERVSEEEAEVIVVSGLYDDEVETPDDYRDLLERLAARGLPMICANPDIVVQRGDRLIWCGGALAREYASLGCEVRQAGKPFRPIYDVASSRIGGAAGKRILCIGDALMTDIKGANDFGVDALLILHGIHADSLGNSPLTVADALTQESLSARYIMPMLK